MNRIFRCAQQSDLWTKARVGRITSSGFASIMAPPTTRASTRNGIKCEAGTESLERVKYRAEKVVERLYKHAADHYVTRAMQEGTEREQYARMLYEAQTQQTVELMGFALHPEWDWFGVSADGLVGELGGVELKSPTDGVHDTYAQDVTLLVQEYQWQCIGCLICFPERQWWDLASFNPFAPDSIKLVTYRFERSEWAATIAAVEKESVAFNAQIEAEIQKRGFTPTVWDVMPQEEPAEDQADASDFTGDAYGFLDENLAGVP